MALSEPVPLRLCELRRPFSREPLMRRIAERLAVDSGARVLELAGGLDGLALPLSREVGAVVIADPDEAQLSAVRDRARASGTASKVEVRRLDLERHPLSDGEFSAVIVHTGPLFPASTAAKQLGRVVAPDGRLALLTVTRVGRYPNAQITDYWEAQMGEPILLPRELLQGFAAAGIEPESAESLSDLELDELYRTAEKELGPDPRGAQLRQEIALHRGQGGKSTFSFSVLVGRRRRPGERPAAPRTGA